MFQIYGDENQRSVTDLADRYARREGGSSDFARLRSSLRRGETYLTEAAVSYLHYFNSYNPSLTTLPVIVSWG